MSTSTTAGNRKKCSLARGVLICHLATVQFTQLRPSCSDQLALLGKIAMKWTWIFHESTGN